MSKSAQGCKNDSLYRTGRELVGAHGVEVEETFRGLVRLLGPGGEAVGLHDARGQQNSRFQCSEESNLVRDVVSEVGVGARDGAVNLERAACEGGL